MKNRIRNSENRIRNSDRELMQQALDLLDDIKQCSLPPVGIPLPAEIDHVMETLRNRLEKWTAKDMAYRPGGLSQSDLGWQELTKKETLQLLEENIDKPFSLLVAVRDKLKEKNGFA